MNRSRVAYGFVTTAAVSGMLVALPASSAFAAATDCPTALPTTQAVDGLTGTGYTVEKGDKAEEFTAKVIGRIKDGIAPGVDMIMADVDSPALERAGGVWAGMSGSPVYTADGKLIGSVSYGLAASSKIAGITPAEDLLALGNSTKSKSRVAVSASKAARIAKTGEVSKKVAAKGFQRLPVPVTMSGLAKKNTKQFLKGITADSGTAVRSSAPSGIRARAAASPSQIFAGSNYAAALSYGDVSTSAIGTTTLVCGTTAVAFGHPFLDAGKSDFSVHPASAVLVQPDPAKGPFKVGNLGGVVGTVTHDGTIGLRSTLGTAPKNTYPITTALKNDDGRTVTGKTVGVYQPYAATIVATHLQSAIIKANGAQGEGSAAVKVTVTGTRDGGKKFSLELNDHYSDSTDVSMVTAEAVFGSLTRLTEQTFENVRITGVKVTGSVTNDVTGYRVTKLTTKKNGEWVTLKGTQAVKPGAQIPVRATLSAYRNSAKKITVPLTVAVPKKTKGASGTLTIADSLSAAPEIKPPNSLNGLLTQLRTQPRNDTLVSQVEVKGRSVTRETHVNAPVGTYAKVLTVKVK